MISNGPDSIEGRVTYHFVVAKRVFSGISPSGFNRDENGNWSGDAAYEGMIFEADDYGQYPHGLWDYDDDYGVKPYDYILKGIVSELGMDQSSTKRSQMCCAIVCVLVALVRNKILDKDTILSALRTPSQSTDTL